MTYFYHPARSRTVLILMLHRILSVSSLRHLLPISCSGISAVLIHRHTLHMFCILHARILYLCSPSILYWLARRVLRELASHTALLFFLSFQFTAIIGAGKVKGVVEDITGLSNTVSGKVDWNNIETTYPVLKPYLDKVGTKVDEVSDQKTSALSLINSIINGFMWRRAAWALGGVMICFVVAALPALTGNGRNRQGQRGASASTRHRTTQHTSRSHRPRRR